MASDNIRHSKSADIQLKLISMQNLDGRTHNVPSTSKVVALIVENVGTVAEERDIIVEGRDG